MPPQLAVAVRKTKGKKAFSKPENALVRKVRVSKWIVDLANGMTRRAIALRDNVDVTTVSHELKWAEQEGFFEKAESAILNRLVPLAIDVFERALRKHLETGDYDAAERLLDKTKLLSSVGMRREREAEEASSSSSGSDVEMTWAAFIARRTESVSASQEEEEATPTMEAEGIPNGTTEK